MNKVNQQACNETVKIPKVVLADTVINPIAVMVKLIDAFIANVAVTRVFCVDCFTVWT